MMKAGRKIIVYIATSADGYIARPDGDVEWLNRHPDKFDYGMRAFYPTIDTILWGRKTYDWALAYWKKKGVKEGMFDKKVANYVFSRKPHPVHRGLVRQPEGWEWSSFGHYLTGKEGRVEIESQWTARKRDLAGAGPKLRVSTIS